MKRFFYSTLLLLIVVNFSNAQFWEKINGPYGGGEFAGQAPNGKIYAKKESITESAFYTSIDDAQTWQEMPVQPPFPSFHPAADGKLISWGLNNLYVSEDEGLTWIIKNYNTIWDSFTKIESLSDGTLFAVEWNRFYRSTDNGENWEQTVDFADVIGNNSTATLYIDPYTENIYVGLLLSSANNIFYLFKSSDNGSTWNEIFAADNYFLSEHRFDQVLTTETGEIFLTGDLNAKIHYSPDGGTSWQNFTVNDYETNYVFGLARTNSGRLLCKAGINPFYSDDNGVTWEPLPVNWYQVGAFNLLQGGVILSDTRSILRSEDDGISWEFGSTGIPLSLVRNIAFVDDQEFYADTPDGLFKTIDGGDTWELLLFTNNWSASKLVVDDQHNVFYLSGGPECWRSTDGGTSFINVAPVLQQGAWIHNVALLSPGGIVISTSDGYWKSEDFGSSWTEIDLGPGNLFIFKRILPHPAGYLIALHNNGFSKSTDDGQSWELLSAPSILVDSKDFGIDSQGKIFTGSDPDFYWTYADLNWNFIEVASDFGDTFFPDDFTMNASEHIFAGSHNIKPIRRSIDGGFSWNYLPDFPILSQTHTNCVEISPLQYLIVGVKGEGLWKSIEPTTNITYVQGDLWNDLEDPNCLPSQLDTLLPNFIVYGEKANGELVYGYANDLATYVLPVDEGSYTISSVPPSPYWESCQIEINVPDSLLQTSIEADELLLGVIEECPWMEVEIATGLLRRCFPGNYFVKWCNKGTITAENASINLLLDSLLIFNGSTIPPASIIGNEYTFLLGNVEPGECGQFQIEFEVSCDALLGQVHCTKVSALPNILCPDWTGPNFVLSGGCSGTEAYIDIHNEGGDMSAASNYHWLKWVGNNIIDSGSGSFYLNAGSNEAISIPVNGEEIQFVVEQPNSYFLDEQNQITIQNCNAIDNQLPVNIFTSNFQNEPYIDEFCMENIGSYDPNDKQGFPKGILDDYFIESTQSLEYLIRFQNTGTDTAFTVIIKDTLSPWLDPLTFRLGASSHPCELQLLDQGILLLNFENIMLPDSNVNEPNSHGFVSYTISQRPGNEEGTTIQNRAGIYFDFNEPIVTNTTKHTVSTPISVATEEAKRKFEIQVAPNPFGDEFKVFVKGIENSRKIFRLYDITGRLLDEVFFYEESFLYNTNYLSKGIYLSKVFTENGAILGSIKVIKQ